MLSQLNTSKRVFYVYLFMSHVIRIIIKTIISLSNFVALKQVQFFLQHRYGQIFNLMIIIGGVNKIAITMIEFSVLNQSQLAVLM